MVLKRKWAKNEIWQKNQKLQVFLKRTRPNYKSDEESEAEESCEMQMDINKYQKLLRKKYLFKKKKQKSCLQIKVRQIQMFWNFMVNWCVQKVIRYQILIYGSTVTKMIL